VDRFGQKVYSVAYHFTLKREDAEELAQEIFLKVFENLHRYDGGFPLVAWIVSLSRNLCIDRYRRRKRERSFRFVSEDAVAPLLQSGDDPAADTTWPRSLCCGISTASPTKRSGRPSGCPTAP